MNFRDLDDLIHSGKTEITLDSDVSLEDEEKSQYIGGIKLNVDDLILDGNGHRIDACAKARIFECTAKNVKIRNVILENGFSDASSGAIVSSHAGDGYCEDIASAAIYNSGELSMREVAFSRNRATWGAAIYNRGKVSIYESKFDDNRAQLGGAVYNDGGRIGIYKSKFRDNESKFNGGAIYNTRGRELKISESEFHRNSTNQFGGAIYNQNGVLNIIESTIMDNHAKRGGAIYNWEGEISVTASTFYKNSSGEFMSSGSGGAIYSEGYGKLNIMDSGFNKNRADGSAGAIYAYKTDVSVSDSSFLGNISGEYFDEGDPIEAQFDLALLVMGDDNLELNNCTFDNGNLEEDMDVSLADLFS